MRMSRKIKDSESSILAKRSKTEKIVFGVVLGIFIVQSLTLIYPVLWMLISALKTGDEYIGLAFPNGEWIPEGAPYAFWLPQQPVWKNFIDAFSKLEIATEYGSVNFVGMIFNTLWYVAIMTFFSVLMPAITGYVLSKYRFMGRNVLYTAVITSMTIPLVGTSAAYMKFVGMLGIYDTPLFAVYNGLGLGFGGSFLVFYGFFKSVSWSYAEAVQIDGGGPFTIFFKIMLPQAKPVLLTYAITNAIVYWNEYESVLLYMPRFPTLAAGLIDYKTTAQNEGNFPIYFAGLIISMIPTLVLFSVFSNRIMGSISIGGLKG